MSKKSFWLGIEEDVWDLNNENYNTEEELEELRQVFKALGIKCDKVNDKIVLTNDD